MGTGSNLLFNIISLVFTALTVIVLLLVIGVASDAMTPPFFAPEATSVPPTSVLDLGITPTRPFIPTFTPSSTPDVSNTPTETPEPSATNTELPTATVTNTSAPAPTFTPIPSETPAEAAVAQAPTENSTPLPPASEPSATPTDSPYRFMLQPGTPNVRENFANSQGCSWQGVGGQVVDQSGDPVIGVQVRVLDAAGNAQYTISGTNSAYGPSGWEIALGAQPAAATYQVQLWSANQGEMSPSVEIAFAGTCDQNLALVNFVRTR